MSKISDLFNSLTTVQKSLVVAILSLILFAFTTVITYTLFSGNAKQANISSSQNQDISSSTTPKNTGIVTEDPTQPKTAQCPLNGSMHIQAAKDQWMKRRPLAVMIENHIDARPQSGLSSADIVYEAVAEGGITRFMAIFYCNYGDAQVGPVRSARTYFIDWLSEYNALYAHVGGANAPGPADALGQIIKYGILDLNQFSIGFPTYWRDYERLGHPVATEHTMYSTIDKLWAVGASRGWTNINSQTGQSWDTNFVPWKFKDPSLPSANTENSVNSAPKVHVEFWTGFKDYAVDWKYDGTCSCYKRYNAGVPHIDLDTNKQLTTSNVVVQFETETHANDGYENNVHLLYGTIGSGKALIFEDGKVIEGKWIKTSRLARSKYVDGQGNEVAFNRGPIWIETVPEGANVTY